MIQSVREDARRKYRMRIVVVMQSQTKLFQIVGTLRSPRSLPRRLHSRQEQGNENTNNCNDDQQFD